MSCVRPCRLWGSSRTSRNVRFHAAVGGQAGHQTRLFVRLDLWVHALANACDRLDDGPQLQRAAIDHLAGDAENDSEADIGDPSVLPEQAGDDVCGEAHQGDRQAQSEDEHRRMRARGAKLTCYAHSEFCRS
jgi:hypothetical protein